MIDNYVVKRGTNFLSDREKKNLYAAIDSISDNEEKEWVKIDVLSSCNPYIDFLKNATKVSEDEIRSFLKEYQSDEVFKTAFLPNLRTLGKIEHAGDLRFHALTLYVITRVLKPSVFIETGVAQGKSSSLILLALHKNQKGELISIDLPNPTGGQLADGSFTSTGSREVGWMVPDYLRDKWTLILGDSKIELPALIKSLNGNIDIFLHDSLHTYDHVRFEIETMRQKMDRGIVIIDNLETEAGHFFDEMLEHNDFEGHIFSNLGIIQVS